MMNKLYRIILPVLSVFLFAISACAPVYNPSARHTHLLDQKGEVHASVQAGTNGMDMQGAYAVSDNVGFVAAASWLSTNGSSDYTGSDFHEHRYGELGLSYFETFGKAGRIEVLGGFGMGEAESIDRYDFFGPQEVRATGKFNKLFLQGNAGIETGALETGVAVRLSQVTFTEFKTSDESYGEKESGAFFEPAAFVRLGWQNIKIESQLGIAGPINGDVPFDYVSALFTVGLHFSFNAF